jgi:hypothetical protein
VFEDVGNDIDRDRCKAERAAAQARMDGLDAELDLIEDEAALKAFWPEEIDPLP